MMRMQGMACKWDFFSLFPAYAGVILYLLSTVDGKFAFPRVCGGDPIISNNVNTQTFFSPRMRG